MGVLKHLTNFTGKQLCWVIFLIKLQAYGLRPATLLKKITQHRYFPVKLAELLRTSILKNICERLLLEEEQTHTAYLE